MNFSLTIFVYWERLPKQECIPVGCVPSTTVAICWGQGGLGVVSQHALRQTPHCGQRDRCKNITFATSLRTVIRCVSLIRLSRGLSGIFVFFPCKLTTNSLILMTNNSIVVIRILSIDSILNVRMLSIMHFRNVQ